MLYPVILAGGSGTRLWPASTQNHPKQFKALLGAKTLLQETYDRLANGFDSNNVFLVTADSQLDFVQQQIKITKDNILLEPQAKGTAMAIGLAALVLSKLDSDATIVTVNSDYYIKENDKYLGYIKQAADFIDKRPDRFLLLGIKPQYPETGYGYIEKGEPTDEAGIFTVRSFKEKPDKDTAKKYMDSGNYFWNPAIFVFKASQLLEWYKKYLPQTYQALISVQKSSDYSAAYDQVDNISIDYGLLEKMSDMLLMPVELTWADIGNWRSLRDVQLLNNASGNVVTCPNVLVDSQGNLLYSFSNKLVAAFGVKDMILVETDEVIFLCPADRAQDIKAMLVDMSQSDLKKYL